MGRGIKTFGDNQKRRDNMGYVSLGNIVNLLFAIFIGKALFRSLGEVIFPKNIEVVSLEGVIKYKGEGKFKRFMDSLAEIAKRAPKALIVRINSPGGTVGASQEIYEAIKKVQRAGTKVVALMEDVAASGGLYVALAADQIVANAGTITGSIGVVMQGVEYSRILEWLEIKTSTIKSGEFKDIGSPARPMTPEDRELLQDVVLSTYEQFASTVAKERELDPIVVKTFADGRIFNGMQAKEYGVVDEVGGFDTALRLARELGGIAEGKEQIGYSDKTPMFLEKFTEGLRTESRIGKLLTGSELTGIPLWLLPGQ